MADSRNPSGRRPPVLPLPAPPPDLDDPPRALPRRVYDARTEPGYVPRGPRGPNRPVSADATAELPRLPEVEIHDESSEIDVRMDHRALAAPHAQQMSGARSLAVPAQDATRSFKPTAPQRMRPPPQPAPAPPVYAQQPRPPIQPAHPPDPRPPARSAAVRVQTAVHSTLIGGRYQIAQRIGQGGMGKVYKVTHTHLSRTFALKIISSQVAETDEARELFYREARFASAMAHPNITSVVDFGEDEKVGMFMVMEYVDGESLNKVLFREKRMDVKKACEIVLQVAEALHYIHKQNVVHCDIKTENILIGEEELEGKRRRMFVKLLDFGLARSLTASRASTSLSGTPHYVAPERIRGEPASPSSDVYGVGILLYELICGQVPWDGPVQKILAGHLDEQPVPPTRIVEGLDPALENLILHALAKRPAERHKDMAAFIYELRTVMDMLGIGRNRKAGPAKRVVIERGEGNKRDELARIAFDACRLPLALLTSTGYITAANPAFAKFVMGVAVGVEGLPVKSTPLAQAWSTSDADLARTIAGNPIRRIIEIDVAGGEVRRLLLWLDAVSRDQVVLGVQPIEL